MIRSNRARRQTVKVRRIQARAATLTDADITVQLVDRYGQAIVSTYLPTTVLRRQAWQVHVRIADREFESIARAWMIGMNPQLGDRAPILAIAAGRITDVEIAADAYLESSREAEAAAAVTARAGGLDKRAQRPAQP